MERNASDEIDLYSLLVKIIRLFKTHIRLFSILVLSGMSLAVAYYATIPKTVAGQMIVLSNILTSPYSSKMADGLGNLIGEKKYDTLASRLHLSAGEAAQIKGIKVEGLTQTSDSIFTVNVIVEGQQMIPKLQAGILDFLRRNEFLKTRVRQRQELYRNMIERVGKEIKSLDSLKSRWYQNKISNKGNPELSLLDHDIMFTNTVDLYKAQIKYKNALELVDGVQLVSGFATYEKQREPGIYLLLFLGFLGGLFVSFLYLGIRWIIGVAKT